MSKVGMRRCIGFLVFGRSEGALLLSMPVIVILVTCHECHPLACVIVTLLCLVVVLHGSVTKHSLDITT